MEMKAVNGNGMQYGMGRLYYIEGELILCLNGFHFCGSIEGLNGYYDIKDSRIFEIEAGGKIIRCDDKYAAGEIKLVRKLTKEEIKDYFQQNQEDFIKSNNWYIRHAVAGQGYGLDILINDKNSGVRQTAKMAVKNHPGYFVKRKGLLLNERALLHFEKILPNILTCLNSFDIVITCSTMSSDNLIYQSD